MKKVVLFIVMISFGASAQQFAPKWNIKLPAGSEPLLANWADVNNDSILDLVLETKINGHISFIALTDSAFQSAHVLVRTGFVSGRFGFCDFDHDDRLDILLSGLDSLGSHRTVVFLSSGPFTFQDQPLAISNFSSPKTVFTDLNSDGQDDLVMAGNTGSMSAFKWQNNSLSPLFDSTQLIPQDILVSDFDGNGFNDIAVSGTDGSLNPKVIIIEFANAFDTIRTIRMNIPIAGKMDAGDLNSDGYLDLLISGIDKDGKLLTQSFINRDSSFTAGTSWKGLNESSMELADLDSDGSADVAIQGKQDGTPVNFVRLSSGDSLVLPVSNVASQSFGDFDRDGDLDLVLLQDTLGLVVLENTENAINQKPVAPSLVMGLFIFNRLFLYWQRPGDDHTAANALTYDLFLKSTSNAIYSAEFDTANWQRLSVSYGNLTTHDFSLLKIPFDNYHFQVQTVDNSFVGSKPAFGSCNGGSPGGGGPCDIQTNRITSCKTEPIDLRAQEPSLWFSFSKGFLGLKDSVSVNKSDTLFSFPPLAGPTCGSLKIYVIHHSSQDTIKITNNRTVCEGAVTDLTTASEWEDVVWRNPANDSIGSGQHLQVTVKQEESLLATAHNEYGCSLKQTENIHISKPVLVLNGEAFKIMKGESVSLQASGANVYVWKPNQSLDNGFISNPVATPAVTTTYLLTGYDTLGCPSTATVLVEVEQTAFAPNLFTPNGDGKNDEFKLYGLAPTRNLHFSIHNREGNVVYEASDLASVSSTGWDGLTRGVPQPPGLYYWKVEGNFDDGSQLKVNGRTTGSLLLVR